MLTSSFSSGRIKQTTLLLCAVLLVCTGCDQNAERQTAQVKPASLATRAQRRAYDGAPPVIPHERFGVACTSCHEQQGKLVPTVGLAPANPHWGDPRDGSFTICTQCHLFGNADSLFVENDFAGLAQVNVAAERAYPGAPPVIPHPVSMRNNCNACHTGEAARPEIRCSHPQRTNCVQCHLVDQSNSDSTQLLGQH